MKSDFGLIGLGVMGSALAENVERHGHRVAVWNYHVERVDEFLSEHPGKNFQGTKTLEEFVAAMERPRRILMMIKAGKPVDSVLEALTPLLDEGDVVIDGGNSYYEDTERREATTANSGFHFIGMGVSGGEEGARVGPSMMPGGPRDAYDSVANVLEAIAARSDLGPCVDYIGKGGAGHAVKMVHNGIEYGDMQIIAEVYDVARRAVGLANFQIADVFDIWNRGRLESFLVEITADILRVKDPRDENADLVDAVLDKAGQKGTGRWTARDAIDVGEPVPTLTAAVDARVLSSWKERRVRASELIEGNAIHAADERGAADVISDLEHAFYASRLCAYAQGLRLIRAMSDERSWGVDLKTVGRVWRAGCIIRARLLDEILSAFESADAQEHLFFDARLRDQLVDAQSAWRRVVSLATRAGVPTPALSASLGYFDSFRSARLPQNLTQAQRDTFGAHTYKRVDTGDESHHTDWRG